MSKNKETKQIFLICPNCGRRKNADYATKQKKITAKCICGTYIIKENK